MAGETTLTIVGNLTADPEIRTIGTGATVANFTVASTPRVWNRQTNQYEDGQALFMRCSAWRDMAGHIAQSLKKGVRVIVTGRLQQRSYQAQDGSNRTIVELQVDEIGPSLRYAVAAVAKQFKPNGFQKQPTGSAVVFGWLHVRQSATVGLAAGRAATSRQRPVRPTATTAIAGAGSVGLRPARSSGRWAGRPGILEEDFHVDIHSGHSRLPVDAEPA